MCSDASEASKVSDALVGSDAIYLKYLNQLKHLLVEHASEDGKL